MVPVSVPPLARLMVLLFLAGQSDPLYAQSGGEAPASQTSAPTAPAQFATPYDIGPSPAVRFTLERALYALGWTDHARATSAVAGADEKMLIFYFTVENTGTSDLRFRANTLKFQAIDEQGLVHERTAPVEVRAARLMTAGGASTRRVDDTPLRPGEPLQLYTAILVPKHLLIRRLVVGTTRDGNNEIDYPLEGQVQFLPNAFHGTHPAIVREEIEAGTQQFLAASSFDIRIDGIETTDDPTRVGRRAATGQSWALVRMTVRNRSVAAQNISVGSFKETRLVDAAGATHQPSLVVHETRPESVRPRIDPGASGSFIVAFRLPEGASPERLSLQVSGTGKLSHRYVVPFSGGPRLTEQQGAPVAPGVLYAGIYATMAATPVQPIPGIVMPAEPAPAPAPTPAPSGQTSSPAVADGGAGAASQPAPAAMPRLARGSITLNSIHLWGDPSESGGDEPYLMVWGFRGTLRPGGYGSGLVVLESQMVTLGPNNYLTSRYSRDFPYRPESASFRQRFPYSFADIQPYEFYGIVVTVIEADASSHAARMEYGRRLGSHMHAMLRDLAAAAPMVDTSDASANTQRAYLSRVEQAIAQLHRQNNSYRIFTQTAGAGFGDKDDFLGIHIFAGVHLPAVNWPADLDRFMPAPSVMRPRELRTVMYDSTWDLGIKARYELRWRHDVTP